MGDTPFIELRPFLKCGVIFLTSRKAVGLVDTKKTLIELKSTIAEAMMKRYNAADTKAFEVSEMVLAIIDTKISECDGE